MSESGTLRIRISRSPNLVWEGLLFPLTTTRNTCLQDMPYWSILTQESRDFSLFLYMMILNTFGQQASRHSNWFSCTPGKLFARSRVSVRLRSDSLAFQVSRHQTLRHSHNASFCQLFGTKTAIAQLLYQQLDHFIHAFLNSLCQGCDGRGCENHASGVGRR